MKCQKRYDLLVFSKRGFQLVVWLFAILFISPLWARDANFHAHRQEVKSVCEKAGTSDEFALIALEGIVAQADAYLSELRALEVKRNVARIRMEMLEGRGDEKAYKEAESEYLKADAAFQENSEHIRKLSYAIGEAQDCIKTRRAKIEADIIKNPSNYHKGAAVGTDPLSGEPDIDASLLEGPPLCDNCLG